MKFRGERLYERIDGSLMFNAYTFQTIGGSEQKVAVEEILSYENGFAVVKTTARTTVRSVKNIFIED